MALKKSGVRVSLAPFVLRFAFQWSLCPFFLLVCLLLILIAPLCVSVSAQQPNSELPEAVLYAMSNAQGGITLSVAYRDKVLRKQVESEVGTLAARLKLSPLSRLDLKTEPSISGGTPSTSAYVKLSGELPANNGYPILLPFLEAFRGHKQILIVIPADTHFDVDRTDQVASTEAYRVQWMRGQEGAYQYEVKFQDPEAVLSEPVFHAVISLHSNSDASSSDSVTRVGSTGSQYTLLLLAILGGITLVGGVLLVIRHRRVMT